MRSSNRAVRGACLSLAALIASFVMLLPNSPAQAVPDPTQNNGCLGVTGTFSQFAVPITGTAAPSPVTAPNPITLSGTSVQISVDSTLIGAGVNTGLVTAADSIANIGTAPGLTQPNGAGVNAVTAAVGDVTLKINGTNTVEGVQTASNTAPVALTFYVVRDPGTLVVTVYTAVSVPPSTTANPARTGTVLVGALPVLIPLGDTTWTPTGGDAVFSEQNIAPSNLLTPNAADQAAAPLILLPKINGAINVPFKCWPGTVSSAPAVPPATTNPLIPGPSSSIAVVTVIGSVRSNGCFGITTGFSQIGLDIKATATPSKVTLPDKTTLSGTSVEGSVDSTLIKNLIDAGIGARLVSTAASLADVGTSPGPGQPNGAGVNEATAASGDVALKISGTNTSEGVQTASNTAPVSLPLYVVKDSGGVTVYTALSTPPNATPNAGRTGTALASSLSVMVPLGDTTWTPTGGDIVFSQQKVVPSNLLTPTAADQSMAPLTLKATINGAVQGGIQCWPGAVAAAPNSPLKPLPSFSIAIVTVINAVTTTTAPPTTTLPTTTIKTATAVTGTGTYVSTCSNSVTPDKSKLTFAITGTAPSDVVAGNTVTLSKQSWTVGVPGTVLDTGINLGLLQAGQLVNGTVTGAIFATNTKEGTVTAAPSPVQFGPIVVDSVSGKAAEGKSTFTVADMTWTAVGGDVAYVMAPTSVQVSIGALKVNFNCTPDDTGIQIIKTAVSGSTGIAPATQVESAAARRALANTGPRDMLRNLVLGLILLNLGYLLYSAARPPRRQTVG